MIHRIAIQAHARITYKRSFASLATIVHKAPDPHSSVVLGAPKSQFKVPIIDFSLMQSKNRRDRSVCYNQILDALRTTGFFYMTGYDNLTGYDNPYPCIKQSQISCVFDQSKWFFAQTMEEKAKLAWATPESNRGYVAPGREKVTSLLDKTAVQEMRNASPDFKESMEIGKEPSQDYSNNWPGSNPEFRKTMMEFYDTAHILHLEIMNALALAFNLGNRFFDQYCGKKDHNLRLLHYPAVAKDVLDREGQTRAGAHSDYGSLTLLFQDDKGGLEVKDKTTGQWVPVTPIPNTIVINSGDLLSRWSNDMITSTEHRVTAPPIVNSSSISTTSAVYPERYSVVYFCNPNWDADIEVLPPCRGKQNPPKYEPINTHRYLVSRLSATY